MPIFEIQTPDGKTFQVDAPDMETAASALKSAPSAPYDPMKTLKNAPGSAYEFGKAMVQPFIHPIDTLQTVGDLGAGALREGARKVLPESVFGAIEGMDPNPAAAAQASQTAGAVGDFYKNRYGSWGGFKRAMESDPVGVAGDAATVLTGGGAAISKVGPLAKVGSAVQKAGDLINPVYGAELAIKGTGKAAKNILGVTTGTSADTVGEAYKAGRAGGPQGDAFRRNLRGQEDQAVVVEQARKAVSNLVEERRRQYQSDMASVQADKTPIDFDPIVDAFNDAYDSAYYGGHQKASNETVAKLQQMGKVLEEWQNDPSAHNAGGLDALKIRIDNLMPSFTEAGNSGRVVTQVRNAVKDQIVKQAPQYAKAMQSYEDAKILQTELEKSLSLGNNAAVDTTLRKLQSITRNNANTNYGSRVKGAKTLEGYGADTIMPSLAGQAMGTMMPRGVVAPMLSGGIAAAGGLVNPLALSGLLAASPRLVGEASHLAGRAGRRAGQLPLPKRRGLLGARAIGSVGLLGQQKQ